MTDNDKAAGTAGGSNYGLVPSQLELPFNRQPAGGRPPVLDLDEAVLRHELQMIEELLAERGPLPTEGRKR